MEASFDTSLDDRLEPLPPFSFGGGGEEDAASGGVAERIDLLEDFDGVL